MDKVLKRHKAANPDIPVGFRYPLCGTGNVSQHTIIDEEDKVTCRKCLKIMKKGNNHGTMGNDCEK